jgi:anti-anti-sigma factor
MALQDLSDQVSLITLPREPHLNRDLEIATRLAGSKWSRHVVVDFSRVQIMPSAVLCSLIILRRLLNTKGRQLILCSLSPNITGIFRRVGLQNLFHFAEDRIAALHALEQDVYS